MHRDREVIDHSRFQELAALAATGQLSAAEYALLEAHLAGCPACREEYGDFQEILHGQLPLLHADLAPQAATGEEPSHSAEYKERFFARAQAEGLPFASVPTVQKSLAARFGLATQPAPALAYAAVLVLAVLAGFLALQWRQASMQHQASLQETQALIRQNSALQQQLSDKEAANRSLSADELAAVQAQNAALSARHDAMALQLRAASDEVADLQARLQAQAQAGQDRENRLSKDLELSRAAVGQMTLELESLRRTRAESALAVADYQTRIEELQGRIADQTESLDRIRKLLAADRDIRELMGARNLHITDVYDVDAKGKTRQLFGRVFYTKEKSLIFYAFDLQNPQLAAVSQSFQAWGYRESGKQAVRSLGIFYLDDKNQNRWALKFDDPQVLAEIDAVFVTVEPLGGSSKPTGQKLLYAYLRGDANHP